MPTLITAPNYSLMRTVAVAAIPDVADPTGTPQFRGEGYTHAVVYWTENAGVAAETDTLTLRIIGYDTVNAIWVTLVTITALRRQRIILPLAGMPLFVRIDAQNTTATSVQIFAAGYTPESEIDDVTDESDLGYVILPEQATDPGGPGGVPDTGFVYSKDVAGITELFYEDSNGTITQLTSNGALNSIWIDVTEHGVVLDGVTDNTAALQALIDASPDGSVFYFREGTCNLESPIVINDRNNLMFRGSGAGSIIKRAGVWVVPADPKADQKLFDIGGDETVAHPCTNICFQEIACDFNGIGRFGGIVTNNTTGARFINCYLYDSAPIWPGVGANANKDHYSIISAVGSSDIYIVQCEATDIELAEVDGASNVFIIHNKSLRATGTVAIGWFATDTSGPGTRNFAYDYLIEGNLIIDPQQAAILISQEDATNNTIVRRLKILNNTVVHDTIAGVASIKMGYTAATAVAGNSYDDIEIRGNVIYINAVGRTDPAISCLHNQLAMRFEHVRFEDNTVIGASTDDQFFIRQLANSTIKNNRAGDCARGFRIEALGSTHIENNYAETTSRGYALDSSDGGNFFSKNRVAPGCTTPWLTTNPDSSDTFEINVKDLGAVGDGVANDFTPIQSALDMVTPGCTVFFPAGVYLIGSQLALNRDSVHLLGEGKVITQLILPTGVNGFEIGDGITTRQYVIVDKINFTRTAVGTAGTSTVRMRKLAQFQIIGCHFTGGNLAALNMDACIIGNVSDCVFGEVTAVDGLLITNCSLVNITGCYWENSQVASEAHLQIGAGNSSIVVTGNSFGSSNTATHYGVQLAGGPSTGVIISGNAFRECQNGVRIDGASTYCVIVGNTMTVGAGTRGIFLEACSFCIEDANEITGFTTPRQDSGTDNQLQYVQQRRSTAAVGDSLYTFEDLNGATARTAPLISVIDNNVAGASASSLRISRNNNTNTPYWIQLLSTDAGAAGTLVEYYHDSATPAANDVIHTDRFSGRDAVAGVGTNKTTYAEMRAVILDPTDGSEDACLDLYFQVAGSLLKSLRLYGSTGGRAVFESDSTDRPFWFRATANVTGGTEVLRVDDTSSTFLFYVDGAGNTRTLNKFFFDAAGSASAAAVCLTTDTDTGLYSAGPNQLGLTAGTNTTIVLATDIATYTSIAAGATGFEHQLYQNSASPAANDVLGLHTFDGNSSTGVKRQYGSFLCAITTTTNTAEDGNFQWNLINGGAQNLVMTLSSTGVLAVDDTSVSAPAVVGLFDDYDDAMVIRSIYSPEAERPSFMELRKSLAAMGIISPKVVAGKELPLEEGGMLSIPAMMALFGGAHWQARQRIDAQAHEIARLQARVHELELR